MCVCFIIIKYFGLRYNRSRTHTRQGKGGMEGEGKRTNLRSYRGGAVALISCSEFNQDSSSL